MEATPERSGKPDPWIGKTLSARYRVLRKLAEGGMGAVYEAEALESGRRVAVKLLHAHLAKDEQIVERFRREALAASAIGDPRIVEVIELGESDDAVFIAMELLDGKDLGAVLREDGPLPVGRLIRLATEIAGALEAVHEKGIVHRDLKPENVVVLASGAIKLLDFGVSKLLAGIDGAPRPSATRTGTTLGTPHYMAPEQAQAKKDLDHRVDVYALGVVLFRALTGQHPFDDESYPVLVVKICTDPPPPLRTWRGDVPRELEQVVERMLAKDREDRYASMAEVREALAPFASIDAEPWLLAGPSTADQKARVLSADRSLADPHARTQKLTEPAEDAEPVDPPPGARPFPKWILLVAATALLGAMGWAVFEMTGDGPTEAEPALPELPVPQAPRSVPMVASGGGYGWTWINPIPRAMPTWYGVDVASGGDPVVLVGRGGAAVRYEGSALFAWRTGTTAELRGVAWTGAREALAAGDGGALIRLGPDGPRALDTGTDVALRDVAALSATEALVVGDGGTVLRVRGERVVAMDPSTDADLLAAFARGDDVFVVGGGGTLLRLRHGTFTREEAGTSVTLRAVGGCPSGLVYAAGDQGTLLYRKRSGAWEHVRVNGAEAFTALSCDHGRVAAARRDGSLLLVSGNETVALPTAFESAWHAVAGGPRGPTWLVGAGGRLATIEEDHVRTRTAGPTVPIRDLGSMGGALVAVGEWGRILRERERGLEQVSSPTEAGLAAAIQMGEGRVIAVGDFGAMVDIRFDRAELLSAPTQTSLRDGVAEGDELLVVGASGQILRGPLGLLTSEIVPDVGDLWSVAGTPSDAIAVGESGAILRFVGGRVERLRCASDVTLRSVIRAAGAAWAVGDQGRVVRIEGNACVEERQEGPTLHVIGLGPDGRLLAGGDEGVVLARGTEGGWAPADVDVGDASVRAIWSDDRYVYLGGTGGVLVRHIRVDGTE